MWDADYDDQCDRDYEALQDAIADDLEDRFLEWCDAHGEDPLDEDVRYDFFNR